IGQPANDFFREGHPIDLRAQSQLLFTGQTIPIYECEVRRQDGSTLPLEVNVTLVRDAFEKPLYIQSIARDISRRRQMEQALLSERAQLAQRVAERTTELSIANAELMRNARLKDEFLATVSHELRTPLSVILTLSEALQESIYGAVSDPQQKALQRIQKSGRHLLALINDVLDVSKIESGKLDLEIGPISVQALCEDSLQMVQEAATARQLMVQAIVDPTISIIAADGRRLMQVLLNLLNNAIKFTAEGGCITLKVDGDKAAETITFAVRDNGIGIAQEDLPRLFQPFVQLDSRLSRRYQGAGLGLALVYRLVKLHGGSVSVESNVGEGSTFYVALPWQSGTQRVTNDVDNSVFMSSSIPADDGIPTTAHDDGTGENNSSTIRKQGLANPSKILLVEDHTVALETMENYLRANHFAVFPARSGIEAIALARQHEPDLILMDIQIPEMDGLEAIQTLRRQVGLTVTPIIALTALAMPGDRERCLAAGADVYISKPISLRFLRQMIENALTASRKTTITGCPTAD
ncbi:MAG: response regulator, partial [Caldilineaceae bacterium]|nr:response regulator [Caldilineaceae bacterium]